MRLPVCYNFYTISGRTGIYTRLRFLIEETEKRGIGLMVVSHSEGLLKQVCTRRMDLNRLK